MQRFSVLTHIPEYYPGPLGASLIGKSLGEKWQLNIYNIRDYGTSKHKSVDDEPYGGGAGMVIRADILEKAIEDITAKDSINKIYYPSPKGALLNQKTVESSIEHQSILFISGRFEGIDQRVIEAYNIHEFSIGDYILCGGDLAIMAFIESTVRIIPGVIGKQESIDEDSFANGSSYEHLLEYPHYTRPAIWQGRSVPEILLSGNHEKINSFRLTKAKETTKKLRPDLYKKYLNSFPGNIDEHNK